MASLKKVKKLVERKKKRDMKKSKAQQIRKREDRKLERKRKIAREVKELLGFHRFKFKEEVDEEEI